MEEVSSVEDGVNDELEVNIYDQLVEIFNLGDYFEAVSRLEKMIPPILNFSSYYERNKFLIFLDWATGLYEFEKYKYESMTINRKDGKFCVDIKGAADLRPPIRDG